MRNLLVKVMVIGSVLSPLAAQATEKSADVTQVIAKVTYYCRTQGESLKRVVNRIDLKTASGAVMKVNSADLSLNENNQVSVSDKILGKISSVTPDLNCTSNDGTHKVMFYELRMANDLVITSGQYEDNFCNGSAADSGLISGTREAIKVQNLVDSSNQNIMEVSRQSHSKQCYSLKTVLNDSLVKAASIILYIPAIGADFTYYLFTDKHLFEQPNRSKN